MPEALQDRRPGRRRDGPGAARAGAPRARPRRLRRRRSSSSITTSRSSAGARPRTNASPRPRRRCARPASGSRRRRSRPEGADDVGSPNRILREAGRRQGDRPHGAADPGRRRPRVGRALSDLDRAHGGRRRLRRRAVARGRGGLGRRGRAAHRADHARGLPRGRRVRLPRRRALRRARLRRSRSGRSPPSTRACSRRRWTPPPSAIPRSTTGPC